MAAAVSERAASSSGAELAARSVIVPDTSPPLCMDAHAKASAGCGPEFDDAVQSCGAQRHGPGLEGGRTASSSKRQLIRRISDRIDVFRLFPGGRIEKAQSFLSQMGNTRTG